VTPEHTDHFTSTNTCKCLDWLLRPDIDLTVTRTLTLTPSACTPSAGPSWSFSSALLRLVVVDVERSAGHRRGMFLGFASFTLLIAITSPSLALISALVTFKLLREVVRALTTLNLAHLLHQIPVNAPPCHHLYLFCYLYLCLPTPRPPMLLENRKVNPT
jgi:hypothetical protein